MSETVEVYHDIKGELVNNVLFRLQDFDDANLRRVKTALEVALHDYDIVKTERQIAVYKEQMNERILRRFLIAKQVEGCTIMSLKRGMPIEQVSKMLGHESVATTQIYLDLSDEDLAAAHRKYVV